MTEAAPLILSSSPLLSCHTLTLESSPRLSMSGNLNTSFIFRSNLFLLPLSFRGSVPVSPYSPNRIPNTLASVPAPGILDGLRHRLSQRLSKEWEVMRETFLPPTESWHILKIHLTVNVFDSWGHILAVTDKSFRLTCDVAGLDLDSVGCCFYHLLVVHHSWQLADLRPLLPLGEGQPVLVGEQIDLLCRQIPNEDLKVFVWPLDEQPN